MVSGQLQRTTDNGQKIFSTGHVAFSALGSWLNPTVHQLIKMPLKAGACHNIEITP